MAHMATPWKRPGSGTYYLRRQIPEALRPAFGNKELYQVSLRTKNFAKAAQLFVEANAALEREFELARERLAATGDPRPSQKEHRDRLIAGYFAGGASDGGLDGAERLALAFLEADRLLYRAMGQSDRLYGPPSSKDHWFAMTMNAAVYQAEQKRLKNSASARPGKLWKMIAKVGGYEDARQLHAQRIIDQICACDGLASQELPEGLADAVVAFLDQAPLEHQLRSRKPRHAVTRLRPDMRLGELYDRWKEKRNPSKKCAHEYRGSVDDFIEYIGDIPVDDITADDLLTFRDAVASLPRQLPHADRKLRFSERVTKHQSSGGLKVTGTTVKKRVGGVQAMLSFAQRNRWITKNVGAGLAIDDDLPASRAPRRNFLGSELESLFAAPLFTAPEGWRIKRSGLSDSTMFWLFMIGATSGARLEEVGQPALADVRREDGIPYIDIDDYVSEPGSSAKQIKNDESRRVVPIHRAVIEAGFLDYVEALRRAGHRELFPDLVADSVDSRTHAASQRANRIIDRYATNDPRIVFHSFRHSFKQRGTTALIPERILDQLCGHAPTTVGQRYGAGQPLWVLSQELHKIDFAFVGAARVAAALKGFGWDAMVAKLPSPLAAPRPTLRAAADYGRYPTVSFSAQDRAS